MRLQTCSALGVPSCGKWLFAAVVAVALVATPSARADDRQPPPRVVDGERPGAPERVTEPTNSAGLVALRLLTPIYLGDITMLGGRDYQDGTPGLGVGLRIDGALFVLAGLSVGLALGLDYSALTPRLPADSHDVLTDVFGGLLVGYRGALADLVVLGGSLGVVYHSASPANGFTGDGGTGWGGLAEVAVGLHLHSRVVVGAGVTLELLGGFNRSQLARVTPALHFELLL